MPLTAQQYLTNPSYGCIRTTFFCAVLLEFTMPWLDDVLHELATVTQWSYLPGQGSAAEPAAFAALAWMACGVPDHAAPPLSWLLKQQQPSGTVGVTDSQDSPVWATSLAILAWQKAIDLQHEEKWKTASEKGCTALLKIRGGTIPRGDTFAHDTMLVGWPWVDGTHSWLEPSAFAVLAFKAAGKSTNPRVREAVQLIRDRLLPDGGANYGNTFVLGQRLLAHVQPSGIALCAIGDEDDVDGRVQRTVAYLNSELSAETTTSSLCFALLGLAVANALPPQAERWLAKAAQRTLRRDRSPYKLALLALAAKAHDLPLLPSQNVLAL
jgi:hypothetical protein